MGRNLVTSVLVVSCGLPLLAQDALPNPSTGYAGFDDSVRAATDFLQQNLRRKPPTGGARSLAAYALVKAGIEKGNPVVLAAVNAVRSRIAGRRYTPTRSAEGNYQAPVDAMLLAAVDAAKFRNELQAIANYLLNNQGEDGSWDYPGTRTGGDTSQCQYAVLGLWACHRAGIAIPPVVWDRCADWHVRNQSADGGWAYHPGRTNGSGEGRSTHNMTFSGLATMAICRRLLYPNQKRKKRKTLFGVLKEIPIEAPLGKAAPKYEPNVGADVLQVRIDAAKRWLTSRWRNANPFRGHQRYFYYAMERAMALNAIRVIENIDWYPICGQVLRSTQQEDGSWAGSGGVLTDTSFAVLFFLRATERDIEKLYDGGHGEVKRGFPVGKDRQAKVEKRSLTKLLWEIDDWDTGGVKGVPEEDLKALAEYALKAQPSELAKRIPLLKKLARNPSAEVRERVVVALGRTGQMRCAPTLIDALADNDVNVLFEANHSLCLICRKPGGIGVERDLLTHVMELPMNQIDAYVVSWKRRAAKRWRDWYVRVRPYDERGDLWELTVRDSHAVS